VNGLHVLDLEVKYVCNINTKRLRPNDHLFGIVA